MTTTAALPAEPEKSCAYRILRYTPNLVRDEWINVGVLVFHPATGERRLRVIEDEDEYARVRRLHPQADETLLRALRDDLEERFETAGALFPPNGKAAPPGAIPWLQLLEKWDNTLSNALQLAPQKGVLTTDLDAETERLYADHVAPQRAPSRVGAPGSRAAVRNYCSQVFRQARLWERLQKSVRAAEFTFPGDPMRLDYAYRRNGTRGFVQTLSVTRAPGDAKLFAYTAERIAKLSASEFTAVTDVPLRPENDRHRFVSDTLRDAGIEPVPMEGFAVWVAKLRSMLQ
ncbi:MAG: hypothetical protein PVS2B2_24360 [Candidatus Acidiferrum sp.]